MVATVSRVTETSRGLKSYLLYLFCHGVWYSAHLAHSAERVSLGVRLIPSPPRRWRKFAPAALECPKSVRSIPSAAISECIASLVRSARRDFGRPGIRVIPRISGEFWPSGQNGATPVMAGITTLLRWSPRKGTEGSNPSVSAMNSPDQGLFLLLS